MVKNPQNSLSLPKNQIAITENSHSDIAQTFFTMGATIFFSVFRSILNGVKLTKW